MTCWRVASPRFSTLIRLALCAGPVLSFVRNAETACAQTRQPTVVVQLRVVSEGGGAPSAATVLFSEVGSTGVTQPERLEVRDGHASLRLGAGREYQLQVTAPGHRSRDMVLAVTGPRRVSIVLPVDPYEMPAVVALARNPELGAEARSVHQSRFSEESLTYATVAEWLGDVPGVAVRGTGTVGTQLLSVRGSRPEDVLVLLDGVPLNDPVTGRADLSMIPTATLESGTLIRGAASQAYGSGASAGVLLLTSREADGTGFGGGVRIGSFGGFAGDVQASYVRGRTRLGAFFSASRADNDYPYRNPVRPDEVIGSRDNADAEGRHVVLQGAGGPLFGSLRFDGVERGVPGRAGTSLFEGARAEDRSWVATVGTSGGMASASASFGRQRMQYRADPSARPTAQEVEELRLSGEVDVPSTPIEMRVRATRESVSGEAFEGGAVRTVVGAGVGATLTSGRFRLVPGVALDAADGHLAASPELSISWSLAPGVRAWGRIGRGFRLPTFGDLYFASQYQVRANPGLTPEHIVMDSEVGAWYGTGASGVRIEASAAVWARRTHDPIVWLSSSASVWSPRNLDELSARGVDLRIAVASPEAAFVGWRAQVVGSVIRSRVGFGSNRNPLPYEPAHSARVSVEGWIGRVGARVDLRHTGPRTTSLAATRSLEDFRTADISIRGDASTGRLRLALYGRIENLLDRRYELVELFPEPGRRFTLRFEVRRTTP